MKRRAGSKAGTAAALMIFCVFAMTVLTVLMLGAGVYKNISELAQDGYDERICLQYIWSKVKNKDAGGEFYVDDFQGVPALWFDDVHGSREYRTVIYCYDGYLRELLFEAGLDLGLSLKDGEPVVRVDSLGFGELPDSGLIRVYTSNEQLLLASRSGAGEVAYE